MSVSLRELLALGEGRSVEFKQNLPPKSETYLKTVIAFANSAGGTLLFGIDDKTHAVTGIDADQVPRLQDAITNAVCDRCEPAVPFNVVIEEVDGKTLLRIDVAEGRRKPYFLKSAGEENGTYVRIAATSRHADAWQLRQLAYSCRPQGFDQTPLPRQVTPAEASALCDRLYRHAQDLSRSNTEKKRLKKINLAQLISFGVLAEADGTLHATPAFELLSGRLSEYPDAVIRCALFKGTGRSLLVSKKECTGPIDEQIEAANNFVVSNLKLGVRIEGLVRKEFLELPEKSLREMIANAVCHRSYLYPEPIRVMIFDDRIEVESPGMLADGLTVERMKNGISRIQNRAIASVFRYIGLVETWGSGIPTLIRESHTYGLGEPLLKEDDSSFVVALRRKAFAVDEFGAVPPAATGVAPSSQSHAAPATVRVPSLSQSVLDYLQTHPQATQSEIARHVKSSLPSVKRAFAQLQKGHRIERIGNNRSGHWNVIG